MVVLQLELERHGVQQLDLVEERVPPAVLVSSSASALARSRPRVGPTRSLSRRAPIDSKNIIDSASENENRELAAGSPRP